MISGGVVTFVLCVCETRMFFLNETSQYVSWFRSAHRFPHLGCLATIVKAWVGFGYWHYPILQLNVLQMAAPRVAICIPPSNGADTCTGAAHACPTQNFYKRDARCISGLTFGWL